MSPKVNMKLLRKMPGWGWQDFSVMLQVCVFTPERLEGSYRSERDYQIDPVGSISRTHSWKLAYKSSKQESYVFENVFISTSGCCWSPEKQVLGRKEICSLEWVSLTWLRECWVFEMQRRRGREKQLGRGVKIATKTQHDLLYTVAGVSCKMKPVAKLEYLKIWYFVQGLGYSQHRTVSLAQPCWEFAHQILFLSVEEGGEKKKITKNHLSAYFSFIQWIVKENQ